MAKKMCSVCGKRAEGFPNKKNTITYFLNMDFRKQL